MEQNPPPFVLICPVKCSDPSSKQTCNVSLCPPMTPSSSRYHFRGVSWSRMFRAEMAFLSSSARSYFMIRTACPIGSLFSLSIVFVFLQLLGLKNLLLQKLFLPGVDDDSDFPRCTANRRNKNVLQMAITLCCIVKCCAALLYSVNNSGGAFNEGRSWCCGINFFLCSNYAYFFHVICDFFGRYNQRAAPLNV